MTVNPPRYSSLSTAGASAKTGFRRRRPARCTEPSTCRAAVGEAQDARLAHLLDQRPGCDGFPIDLLGRVLRHPLVIERDQILGHVASERVVVSLIILQPMIRRPSAAPAAQTRDPAGRHTHALVDLEPLAPAVPHIQRPAAVREAAAAEMRERVGEARVDGGTGGERAGAEVVERAQHVVVPATGCASRRYAASAGSPVDRRPESRSSRNSSPPRRAAVDSAVPPVARSNSSSPSRTLIVESKDERTDPLARSQSSRRRAVAHRRDARQAATCRRRSRRRRPGFDR